MALSYFWRMGSLVLDGTHDFSAGATTMVQTGTTAQCDLVGGAAMAPGSTKGARTFLTPDVGWRCDTASIWNRIVGSYGFLFRFRIENANGVMPILMFTRGAIIQDHFSVTLEKSTTTNLREFYVEHRVNGGGGQSHHSAGANLEPNRIYGMVVRYDSDNDDFRVDLYDPFTRVALYSYEDLSTAFLPPGAFDLSTGFQIGHWSGGGSGPAFDIQNMFVSQSYSEPIEKYLLINSYTQYGVDNFTPSALITPSQNLIEPPRSLILPGGSGPGALTDVRAWY